MSRSESRMMYLRQQLNSGANVSTLSPMISLITNDKFTNPFYKFEIANYLLQANDPKGISILKEVIESDPATPLYLSTLARSFEAQNQSETALSYRLKLEELDPYDARNMLQIAKLYKILGQNINASKYRELIHDFVPNSEISRSAEEEIPYN